MKQLVSQAIVLGRIDYGEADRILTLLTPEYGKLSLLAKGVRRVKSKLAGGIELFSVSTITFVQGRGSVGTLVSTRLLTHYGRIVADLDRTMLGYELIKQFNKHTEDEPEPAYFALLRDTFAALNDETVPPLVTQLWFTAQLLGLGGHTPNTSTDAAGAKLTPQASYHFNFEHMAFTAEPPAHEGPFTVDHIKLLRLLFTQGVDPSQLATMPPKLVASCTQLLQTILTTR